MMPDRPFPPNVRSRPRSDGSTRLWWEPPAKARALGVQPVELDASKLTWSAREATRLNKAAAETIAAGGRVHRTQGARTIEALIEDYKRSSIWTEKLRPKTRESYQKNFRLIIDKWGPQLVSSFSKDVMWTWYQTLRQARGHSQAVALLRAMSLLFSYAEKIGWRAENSNPCLRLGMSVPKGRRRVAGWDEFDMLLAAADAEGLPSIALACQLSLFAGQRQTDVLQAKVEEFHETKARRGANAPIWIWTLIRSKRGNDGAIRLHPEVVPRLAAMIATAETAERNQLLIDERTGKPYDQWSFQRRWSQVRAAAAAELTKLGDDAGAAALAELQFRDLRRTFGVRARQGGASKADTADVLGNSAADNAFLGDVYMAPTLESASRAAEAIRRPEKGKGRKAG